MQLQTMPQLSSMHQLSPLLQQSSHQLRHQQQLSPLLQQSSHQLRDQQLKSMPQLKSMRQLNHRNTARCLAEKQGPEGWVSVRER